MQYAVCCVPVSPLKKEPFHNVEMISQQLFGERCTVLETIPGWIRIRSKYDSYEGWSQSAHLEELDEEQFANTNKKLATGWINQVIYNGEKLFVPFGSSLATFKKGDAIWNNNLINFKGKKYDPPAGKINKKNIKWISGKYLNTSYLWGGKSVFGIDCSGFTQSVYKFLNIHLPRDSWQQAELGKTVDHLHRANCGDLCFFNNEEGRITHVGLLLNSHEIIHSSGKVRIDKIDNDGITNTDTGLRTHKIKMIKRYF